MAGAFVGGRLRGSVLLSRDCGIGDKLKMMVKQSRMVVNDFRYIKTVLVLTIATGCGVISVNFVHLRSHPLVSSNFSV